MKLRTGVSVVFVILLALPAAGQVAAAPQPPFSAGALGGLAAGQGDTGGSVGGHFGFDVSQRIAVEARGIHQDRGSGERGDEFTGTVLVTLARSAHAAPYAAVGGGLYRSTFDLGDMRFFGRMNDQFAAGTRFAMAHGMDGFAMAFQNGQNTGAMFTSSRMPMFYAQRLGQMMVEDEGHWQSRSFTDPALTLGGGVKIALGRHLYVNPDVRGVVVFSRGDHLSLMTMNVGFGVRF